MRVRVLLCSLATCLLLLPRAAEAYIDPGTGSYLLQILAAGLFSALFALKLFWHRIKGLFVRLTAGRARPDKENRPV